jgi:radical SAM superfamily enzyme YgiQ (UPF0313 family)
VYPTILPDEAINTEGVDGVCIGEGEKVVPELLSAIESGRPLASIQGLYFKDTAGIIHKNPLRSFEKDIDSFPWPNWDLWDIDTYMNEGEIVPGTLRTLTTRGCPYSCSFCSNPIWSSQIEGAYYRKRSPQDIAEEVRNNYDKYHRRGFSFLMISDSIFGLDKKHAAAFCREYQKAGLADVLPWGAQIRCGTIDRESVRLMRSAGCVRMNISIESGNDRMRNDVYKKKMTKEMIEETVAFLREAGIVTRAFVMLGGPGETNAMFDETLAFSKKIGLSLSDLIIIKYVPLPCTELVRSLDPSDVHASKSPFCYKDTPTIRSRISPGYYFLLRAKKVVAFIREVVCLRGLSFIYDLWQLIKHGSTGFFPLVYLCSEQRIINHTLVRYKIEQFKKSTKSNR